MKSICVLERVFSALPINSVLRRGMFAAAVLLLFAVVCAVPAAASADDAVVFDGSGDTFDTAEKLAEALGDGNAILSGDSTLKLLKDIKVTGTINITGDMTILSDGITIWRGKNDITLIEVTGGALTLGDGSSKLTIDGQKDIGTNKESLISIRNGASCTMNAGVTLTNNYAEYGGGVFVNDGSTFEMSGDAKISGNIASYAGGGVYVTGRGTFTMYSGTISDNNAAHGGGVYGNMGSTFTMTSGEISDNKAGYGGGVCGNEGSTFEMSGDAKISNNTGTQYGGGVHVDGGTFTMNGGEISGNTGYRGGGVYVDGGTFTMTDGEISGNNPDDKGGGVFVNEGTLTMSGGVISGNIASNGGGGVYIDYDCTLTMSGGEISGNIASYGGGGVYIDYDCTLTMSGGKISNNSANRGGGVFVNEGTLTMSGSVTIAADNELYIDSSSSFVMVNGTSFTGSATNITGDSKVITNGYLLIKINSTSILTASEIQDKFQLQKSQEYTLTPSDDDKNLIVTALPVKIITESLPAGMVDEPYSQVINATGSSPLTWTYDEPSLPPGLTLEEVEERQYRISGTPTVANTYTFWINVTNGQNSCNETFTLTINDLPEPDPQPQPSVGPSGGSSSGDGNMENAFRVLFDTSGGSFISPATGLSYGDRVTKPADPVKDGSTFTGWYKDAGHTQPWDFADGIPGDMTLYAKWTSTTATTQPTITATTAATGTVTQIPVTAATTTTPAATTATEPRRTLVQTPAPVFGVLAGLLAAGVLLRRKT